MAPSPPAVPPAGRLALRSVPEPRAAAATSPAGLEALRARYQGASAEALIIGATQEEFRGEIALLSSFGAEAAVTLHLLAAVDPSVPVLFLDTERHFAQTLDYKEQLVRRLGLQDVRVVRPGQTEAEDADGRLWARDPDLCCRLRKVEPLERALRPFRALITGRKRMHDGARVGLRRFDLQDGVVRVNPLADWTSAEVERYFRDHDLPRHPLMQAGYSSIGCWPCTLPTQGGLGDRSGRWAGSAKTECGIHLPARRAVGA